MNYKRKVVFIGLLLGALLAGCSQNVNSSSNTPATENSANNEGEGMTEAEPFSYTAEQKNEISEAAKKAGLDKVYIPTVELGVDDFLDRVEAKDNQVRIVFFRGSITQSREELKPTNEIASTKKVVLSKNVSGEWITQENGATYLYFEIGGLHFSMESARDISQADYERAAASLEPLTVQDKAGTKTIPYAITNSSAISYGTFSEMDAQTDIVVKGTKAGAQEVVLKKEDVDGLVIDNRTLSKFVLSDVFRNNTGHTLSSGETITVQENAAADSSRVYSTFGYQLMNENEEYLLFLRESLTDPGVYIIRGVVYGKVPTAGEDIPSKSTADDIQFKGDDDTREQLDAIFEDARKAYLN
ncbi:hypothetical protein [Paenibacillus sp. FSL H3-0333]|uniref:hypothetical protein n=1 Tax=Paenibacillus sp. FSL H3-0333 TaxID=2921373 RepID=UPI0030F8705A